MREYGFTFPTLSVYNSGYLKGAARMNVYRKILLSVAALAAFCTAFSLWMQYGFGFDPCVMCIVQRMAILFAGLAAFVLAWLPQRRMWARLAAAVGVSIPAAWAAWTAVQQLHLQSLPPAQQPSCGAPWTFRLQNAPLFDWYEPLIRGFGQCGVIEKFLGVPFPWWSLLACTAMLAAVWGGLWYNRRFEQ
ncbi:disulfide bond formation protein B [Neisseria shayeganii]|uniref:Dsb protein n=1 Tax=Neisseria shayeganii 871 TaxID=1032488 RepID=G4CHK3_9NEIS|nr:disulfide bond formation protein B [Neisseria shayeganii]EGY52668.1 Dsb protein [Neisseria shayeganii 871]